MNGPSTNRGGRNSNLELLRLVSMLGVLNLHSFCGYTNGSGILQAIDFFRECTSICAVNCFLLISGYFGIKWKYKSLFNLIFQLFFYAFAVYGVAIFLGVDDYSLRGLLTNATCLYSYWGFISYYLLLYLCAPLLNAFVETVSNKQLLGYIIILIVSENLITRDFSFLNFCTMYLIGRWISLNEIVNNKRLMPGKGYWATTVMIFAFVYISYKFLHIETAEKMVSLPWGLSYAAPLVVLQSVFLFVWFARLKVQSKWINWCSASCLAVFLIHTHPSIDWNVYRSNALFFYSLPPIEHTWRLTLMISSFFFGAIAVDKIRILVSSLFYNLSLKWYSRVKSPKDQLRSYFPNQASNG